MMKHNNDNNDYAKICHAKYLQYDWSRGVQYTSYCTLKITKNS